MADEETPHRQRLARAKERLASLPLGVRITLFLVGWTLLLAGIAGLFLPILQGAVMILAGAAVLSLVSELIYEWLRLGLRRWPKLWRRIEAFRLRTYRRLQKRWRKDEASADDEAAPGSADEGEEE
jgi:hypothetical protein